MNTNAFYEYGLSCGFFQLLAGNHAKNCKPILQTLEIQFQNDGIMLKLNDGLFSYERAVLVGEALKKFKLHIMERDKCIIRLTNYSSSSTCENGLEKMKLIISDFDLLKEYPPKIGNPEPHCGHVNDSLGKRILNITRTSSMETNADLEFSYQNPLQDDVSVVSPVSTTLPLIKWEICGKITEKCSKGNFTTITDSGQSFNFTITTINKDQIKISLFGDMANVFVQQIGSKGSYIIKGTGKDIRSANKIPNNSKNIYEVIIESGIKVIKYENVIKLSGEMVERVKLSELNLNVGKNIDVVAMIDVINQTVNKDTKEGNKKMKEISLLDESMSSAMLTIWENNCDKFTFDMKDRPVILKNVYVKKFNGKYNLVFSNRSKIIPTDDKDPLIEHISDWYKRERSVKYQRFF